MTAFTRLGSSIWDWEPFTALAANARVLWLALYTSGEAKRHTPGLWQGGIPMMADAARMHPDEVIQALDSLIDREMVEYDNKTRVLRLCELPDAGEHPSNGKVIRSWWTRFRTVPECGVRNAHVTTLWWIIDTGSRLAGKEVSTDHVNSWRETFGQIAIPSPRRRGVRRLADNDTSTQNQPSLFLPLVASSSSGVDASLSDSSYPQNPQAPVDNSASVRQMNKIRGPETVCDTVSDTVCDTNRIPDPGSRIPESSLLSGGRGIGGGHESGTRPVLTLVPAYTANDVLRELAQGPWDSSLDKAYQEALGALISTWGASTPPLTEFALLADYNRHSGRRLNARLLIGCDIHAEIGKARTALDWRDVNMASLAAKLP